ncbi:MAG: CorA family divalent cation transporter [Thermoguttaceae bacterium]
MPWWLLCILADIEFYEIRHSGKSAAFLRGFRTLYIRLIANTIIMSSSFLAMIKILDEYDVLIYLSITLRFPVFNAKGKNFDIFSMSVLIFADKILFLNPDVKEELFLPKLNDFLDSLQLAEQSEKIPLIVSFIFRIAFRIYTASLENFGDVLRDLENDIIDNNRGDVFTITAMVRKQNIFLQQTILPLKEMGFDMQHAESPLITPEISICLHTMSDQAYRIIDSAGLLSEINSGLLDMYANAQGVKMNEIMQTLTAFSVLTIPATVISSIFGMNFEMPGTKSPYGLWIVIAVMIILTLLILWVCRRKHIV